MRLRFLVPLALGLLVLAVSVPGAAAADEPAKGAGEKGGFAKGEKLPGDLSDLLDANGDGIVTDAEARKAAADFQKDGNNKDSDRGQRILDALDADKDGKVNQDEANEGVAKARMNDGGSGQAVAGMFAKLDTNTDGFVDGKEFGGLVQQLGPLGRLLAPRLAQFFTQMDADRDQRISVVESQFAADVFAKQARLRAEKKEDAADKHLQLAKRTLAALDTDKDEKISQKEAARDARLKAVFTQVDSDKDKYVTVEEMRFYLKTALPDLK